MANYYAEKSHLIETLDFENIEKLVTALHNLEDAYLQWNWDKDIKETYRLLVEVLDENGITDRYNEEIERIDNEDWLEMMREEA